jgi:hypothetical protein
MNVEIGTKATHFLFWEYLFIIFGIVSLQCICWKERVRKKNDKKNVPLLSNNVLVWGLLVPVGLLCLFCNPYLPQFRAFARCWCYFAGKSR